MIAGNNFTKNSAISGGALYTGDGDIVIIDNYFQENIAHYGGAVYSGMANITVSSSNFYGNVANNFTANNGSDYVGGRGGAMCILNCTTYNIIIHSTFTSNYAQNTGGAVFLQNCANVIQDNNFT